MNKTIETLYRIVKAEYMIWNLPPCNKGIVIPLKHILDKFEQIVPDLKSVTLGETAKKLSDVVNKLNYCEYDPQAMSEYTSMERSLINQLRAEVMLVEEGSEKKLVPFDLSLEEDRTALLGKRIIAKHDSAEREDMLITRFFEWADEDCEPEWVTDGVVNGSELFSDYVFYDTGKPVGKGVEE